MAWEGKRLVFVEVKTRTSADFGAPESAVVAEKRKRLLRAAADYARRVNVPLEQARFDIVSVVLRRPPKSNGSAARSAPDRNKLQPTERNVRINSVDVKGFRRNPAGGIGPHLLFTSCSSYPLHRITFTPGSSWIIR